MPSTRPSSSRLRRWNLRFLRLSIFSAALALLISVGFEIAVRCIPYPGSVEKMPPASVLLVDRTGRPLAAFAASDGRWHLPLTEAEFSPHLLNAIVAVEDSRFEAHHGVDWSSALGAAKENLFARHIRRGGSTLTMQLHRLRDPQPRGWLTKFQQAVHARQIEQQYSKREILVEYLNRAPFGGGLEGAGAASWRYFGKPCANLSLGEAALLAGLPQAPNRLRPDLHPDVALTRRRHVLARMAVLGQITVQQQADADAEPLTASWRPLPQDRFAGPIADGLLPALLQMRPATGGTVRTSFDRDIQSRVCTLAAAQLQILSSSGVSAAAIAVVDQRTGVCLASVSLEAREDGAISTLAIDLTSRPRSTGSVLKPFIYAAAFDAGIATPETILRDESAAWPGYLPANYDRSFGGEMTAAEALARSRNIPALVLLEQVGVERAIGVMDAAGLSTLARSKRRPGLSLAIGGAEATPHEVAQAFAKLAHGTGILRPAATAATMRALSSRERTAAICREAADTRVAWKTGTSSGHRDAWCAAATPGGVSVVVWLGNADGKGAAALVGQDAAAPLALKLIAAISSDRQADWPETDRELAISASGSTSALARSPTRLVLVSPAPDASIVLMPDLPASQQRISLQAALRSNGRAAATSNASLWWFVDESLVGESAMNERMWWTPSPGVHQIRATDAAGRSVTGRIRISTPG
jgi:penicillin-binding protein 1C